MAEEMASAPKRAALELDDMHDRAEDLPAREQDVRLIRGLNAVHRHLESEYTQADERAMELRRKYRRLVPWIVGFATLAVLLAIGQMWSGGLAKIIAGRGIDSAAHAKHIEHLAHVYLLGAELVAIIVTIALVAWGLYRQYHKRWLLSRHFAERCRLLKFDVLRQPALWCGDESQMAAWEAELAASAKSLMTLNTPTSREVPKAWHAMEEWIKNLEVPRSPNRADMIRCAETDIAPLVSYYIRRRLTVQSKYYRNAMEKEAKSDRPVRDWPTRLFIFSVIAAFFHIVFALTTSQAQLAWADFVSHLLILLAAALPVLGAGIRVYRGAFEFARNVMRFDAKLIALESYARRLESDVTPDDALETIWNCEQIIESEHREWLRLMAEAEWIP